jgi:1-phosphofructokinase family hexose kinase
VVVTFTANPALDMQMVFAQPRLGALNRAQQVRFEASGKGLNVARAITHLGHPAIAVAPLGGAFGDMIAEAVRADGVDLRAIAAAPTRCNVKVVDTHGTLSEFNTSGEMLEPHTWQACQEVLEHALSPSQPRKQHHPQRYVVLSGSLPPGLDANTYATLTEIWQAKGVRVIVDASGDALRLAYDARPWLLKPNQEELATLGYEVSTLEQAQDAALALQASGVANVIVTLGETGAVFALEQGCYCLPGFKVSVSSPVAAGDTLLAAFLAVLHDAPEAEQDMATCRWILAAASARVRDGQYPNRDTITQLLAETNHNVPD